MSRLGDGAPHSWDDMVEMHGRRKRESRCFLEYTKEDGTRGHLLWSPGFKLCELNRKFDEHAERCIQVCPRPKVAPPPGPQCFGLI
jgi:hypothetical protein